MSLGPRKRLAVRLCTVAGLALACGSTGATPAAPAHAEPAAEQAAGAEAPPPARKSDAPTEKDAAQKALCTAIEAAAKAEGLPVPFFTRLIWKESRFRSDAVSPKGAQGIAQFMPGTAAERGLDDPFDVTTAIPASAHYLAELKAQFGNLGLAAAAYNAGPDRVAGWLADTSTLPLETQDYVLSITGVAADDWADATDAAAKGRDDDDKDCLTLAALLKIAPAVGPAIATAHAPWGVQVAGNYSRARALSTFLALKKQFSAILGGVDPMVIGGRAEGRGTRAFYRVRVPVQSRDEGERICRKLQAAGGSCIVLKT
jgi:hypothetical protein